jgi:ABC-type branched-subunit amino acid transport system substrate-binding protein
MADASERRPYLRASLALFCLAGSPLSLVAAGAAAVTTATAPYQHLRDATMGYNGPSEVMANLTEIRIGWFAPSDPADPVNGDLWWAADQAVREANAARAGAATGSFGALPIRLVPCWAPDPWRAGVSLLARMVYDQQPLAIIGSIDSASTHLAEQVVAKANLPLVSPIATDKTATLAGISWMFSCAPDDTVIARALVDAVLAHPTAPDGGAGVGGRLGEASLPQVPRATTAMAPSRAGRADPPSSTGDHHSSILLLTTTDHESRMTAREVMRELSRRGAPPQFRFDLPPGTADAEPALREVADRRPAAVILIADAVDSARMARTVRDRLGQVPLFGSCATARTRFLELAGESAEGMHVPLLFARQPHDEVAARFSARFLAERHHAPDYSAALGYDATRLLIDAIHRAGPNRARIRDALVQLSPWPGIAGPIAFDGTGQDRRASLSFGTVRAGIVVAETAPAHPARLSQVSTP